MKYQKTERHVYYAIVASFLFFMLSVAVVTEARAQAPEMRQGISLQAPSQYTDGSAIQPGNLERVNLWCGTAPGTFPQDMLLANPTPGQTLTVAKDDLLAHFAFNFNTTYYCAATATASNGKTSAYSVAVNFTVPDDRFPVPPLISVQ